MSAAGGARALPDDPRCRDLLAYWFGDGHSNAAVIATRAGQWFGGGPLVDAEIRERFAHSHAAAVAGALDGWLALPLGRLALVILADQVSRHLFRGDERAFAHDALALRWATDGIAEDVDRDLRAIERMFLYLPLEHSESLADQQRSVALFRSLAASVPPEERAAFDGFTDYAERHHAIIARFGRFPHRNAALGRDSTAEEIAFLRQPGSSF
jgi:uncharacterized protein (DUF924 family)